MLLLGNHRANHGLKIHELIFFTERRSLNFDLIVKIYTNKTWVKVYSGPQLMLIFQLGIDDVK